MDIPISVTALPLSENCRREILELCWGSGCLNALPGHSMTNFDCYFRNYEQFCTNAASNLKSITHRHLCLSIQQLCSGSRDHCQKLLVPLLPAGADEVIAGECLEFAARAILLIDLYGWWETESLIDFISRTMACPSTQKCDMRIARSFNARTFAKVAGINIQWARTLNSHLELTGNDSDIAIFSHVTVLDLYENSQMGSIFPAGFIAEIRRTLSLLIPIADKSAKSWFKSQQKKLQLDQACGSCPHLRASQRNYRDFEFFKDRLIIAKEVFDEQRPKSILQVWRDDRNPVQWWTFWIAITVFFLTIIGVVEGALQVYKAYYPSK